VSYNGDGFARLQKWDKNVLDRHIKTASRIDAVCKGDSVAPSDDSPQGKSLRFLEESHDYRKCPN
jgi:hypothetical protein